MPCRVWRGEGSREAYDMVVSVCCVRMSVILRMLSRPHDRTRLPSASKGEWQESSEWWEKYFILPSAEYLFLITCIPSFNSPDANSTCVICCACSPSTFWVSRPSRISQSFKLLSKWPLATTNPVESVDTEWHLEIQRMVRVPGIGRKEEGEEEISKGWDGRWLMAA